MVRLIFQVESDRPLIVTVAVTKTEGLPVSVMAVVPLLIAVPMPIAVSSCLGRVKGPKSKETQNHNPPLTHSCEFSFSSVFCYGTQTLKSVSSVGGWTYTSCAAAVAILKSWRKMQELASDFYILRNVNFLASKSGGVFRTGGTFMGLNAVLPFISIEPWKCFIRLNWWNMPAICTEYFNVVICLVRCLHFTKSQLFGSMFLPLKFTFLWSCIFLSRRMKSLRKDIVYIPKSCR